MAVLAASGLSKSYAARTLFDQVSFELAPKDKVGLVGVNGCGKTTLFRILSGAEAPDAGNVYQSKEVRLGVLQQSVGSGPQSLYAYVLDAFSHLLQAEAEFDQVTAALENAAGEDAALLVRRQAALQDRLGREDALTMRSRTRSMLLGLGFTEPELAQPLATLSGGQRNKAQLARLLLSQANLLLLDEPTNHLDIDSRDALESALEAYEGTLLVVTHDRYLVNRLADRVLYLTPNGIQSYIGGYDDYLSAREAESQAEAARQAQQRPQNHKPNAYREQKERQSAINRASGEVRRLEDRIAQAEEQLAQLNSQLASPEVATDYVRSGQLAQQAQEAQAQLDALYTAWEAAQEAFEALTRAE